MTSRANRSGAEAGVQVAGVLSVAVGDQDPGVRENLGEPGGALPTGFVGVADDEQVRVFGEQLPQKQW